MTYVVPLEACGTHLVEAVGGKAVGLAALLREDLRVPPGFAVSTHAYRELVGEAGLDREIQGLLAAADSLESRAAASRRIGDLFEELEPRAAFVDELARAYEELGEGTPVPVAVRSSAISEDAGDASFAGEHETYLWIRGAGAVTRSVLRCWASLFTPQALTYFDRVGVLPWETAMGVVVQRMVPAEAAGVMMTLDPITGDRSQISIEGAFGLGAAVVGGEVTPDRFSVDKVTLELRSQTISAKHVAYRFDPARGETGLVDVPVEEQSLPCLAESEVVAIASLGKRVERALGAPQDIEWAVGPGPFGQREVFLLQTRPETVRSRERRASSIPGGLSGLDLVIRALGGAAPEQAPPGPG